MDHKEQHVIPHCYQKAWVDPTTPEKQEPYIWLFNKKGDLIKNKSPKNTFTEVDFYTIPIGKTGRDLKLEKGLQTLENLYAKVYREVISKNYEINEENKLIICAFVAAMHSRTWAYQNFLGNQFNEMYEMGKMAEMHLRKMERNPQKYAVTVPQDKNSNSFTLSDIKELADRPLQSLMFPKITADIALLITMDLAILCNDTDDGFVSSDDPCTFFDSKKTKGYHFSGIPPLARDTIEVTLPVSPEKVILMTRSKINGYLKIDKNVVSKMNHRTISTATQSIIYNSKNINKEWFQ